MSERQFAFGADVSCADGNCGKLGRVIIDPNAWTVTHIVVEPKHGHAAGRLVPFARYDPTADGIGLHCTLSEFESLDPAEETRSERISGGPPALDSLLSATRGEAWFGTSSGVAGKPETVTYERLPSGGMPVRSGVTVQATDGLIGQVDGLVVDPGKGQVTHLLLQEGHLWGRKELAIPVGSVDFFDEDGGIQLKISKGEVASLATG